jgi:hypothetical protein
MGGLVFSPYRVQFLRKVESSARFPRFDRDKSRSSSMIWEHGRARQTVDEAEATHRAGDGGLS